MLTTALAAATSDVKVLPEVLPRIPVFEKLQVVQLTLPLAYGHSAASMRGYPVRLLMRCFVLADRLGIRSAIEAFGEHLTAQCVVHWEKKTTEQGAAVYRTGRL